LQSEHFQSEPRLSSPSPERLRAWRLYFESALALVDVLDAEFERDAGLPIRWYDVLVQLEETADGLRMNELAEHILYSKSGFTRVVDRMEEAGLVRRVYPETDRRSIFVVATDKGLEAMERARRHHRHWIEEHFSRPLSDTDIKALIRARSPPEADPRLAEGEGVRGDARCEAQLEQRVLLAW
jgi:DNA-binding MarR family transcriptional regulator